MGSLTFLEDLAVLLIVAGAVTLVCRWLKQPVVLGYLLAGILIGPHAPPFPLIDDAKAIQGLANLGVILLMFSLGLEFNLRKLRAGGPTALVATVLEVLLMLWLGYEIGRLCGWSVMDSVFAGAMLSISSTMISVRTLTDLGLTKAPFAKPMFGILIVEDMLAMLILALLSGIAMSGGLSLGEVGLTLGRLAVFLVVTLLVGLLAVPRLLGYIAGFRSNEMLLITALALCFGAALLAASLGFSVALGAFLSGAVVAEAREIGRIEQLTAPLRDLFGAVFFVAIGLLIDPKLLWEHALPIAILTFVVIVGKVLSCSLGAFVAGHDLRTALRIGTPLAQIGEFSFIIASLGVSLRVTSDFLYPVAVGVSVLTAWTTPLLVRNADRLEYWFDRLAPPSLLSLLTVYTRWVGQLARRPHATLAGRLVRRWLAQMGLNLALTAAVFIAAASVARQPPVWLSQWLDSDRALHAALWLTAVVAALPLLIATFRKLQALGLLVAELNVRPAAAGERTTAIRGIVAQVIPFTGLLVLGLCVLLLSSAFLPPLRVLLVLLVVVALVLVVAWRACIRLYATAQFALQQTLAQPPPAPHHAEAANLPGLLREAHLATVRLAPGSPAASKLIRELQLRTATGASIVALERDGASLINPGPDEELLPGDQVLLLGRPGQLEAARAALEGRPAQ